MVIRKSLVFRLPSAEIFMHRVQKTLFLLHFAILGLTNFHSKMIVLNPLVNHDHETFVENVVAVQLPAHAPVTIYSNY